MDNRTVFGEVLASLSSCGGEPTDERTWRFGERMTAVYREHMARCDEDEQTRKWRHLYSAENMPPPSDTQSKADVAAMMAFYSPTNFCKMRRVAAQQLLDWCWREPQINVYPFGMPTVTLIDIGAGVGIASLAVIELLAVWSDVLVRQGYRQAGLSVRVIAVEPDVNKQYARRELFSAMSSMLDGRSVRLDGLTEILLPTLNRNA